MKNLSLSDQQYETLLKMVHLGKYMVDNAAMEDPIDFDKAYQKMLSFAPEFNLEKAVLVDVKKKTYSINPKYIEEKGNPVNDIIDAFENVVLFEDLADEFAAREVRTKYGAKIEKMKDEELAEIIGKAAEKYLDEFEENGLKNVKLEVK